MENFEKLIKDIVDSSGEDIKKRVREDLKTQVVNSLSYSLREKITQQVNEYLDAEFQVEIKTMMDEVKPIILAGMKNSLVQIGAKITEAMYTQALNNISLDSYRSRELIKKIFE